MSIVIRTANVFNITNNQVLKNTLFWVGEYGLIFTFLPELAA
ncbi:Uncharacterised protein [Scardovia inopinata]|uniref:Uncharacterized protein n=1 Tax=Scardovia inopinata F0304 TaxID=641146 RepID=W1MXC8_SCAIO|nr:hypothetical protein HMPREF9020_01478 [Scardovia inopinata F0304]SUV51600.1 Uncharacterised protein [Scardovia inopinata]